MLTKYAFAAAAVFAVAQPAWAAPVASATSPDGTVSVELNTDGDGRVSYSVSRKGKAIVAPSKLGFLFTDAAKDRPSPVGHRSGNPRL